MKGLLGLARVNKTPATNNNWGCTERTTLMLRSTSWMARSAPAKEPCPPAAQRGSLPNASTEGLTYACDGVYVLYLHKTRKSIWHSATYLWIFLDRNFEFQRTASTFADFRWRLDAYCAFSFAFSKRFSPASGPAAHKLWFVSKANLLL